MLIVFSAYSQGTSGTDTSRSIPIRQLSNALQAKDSLDILVREAIALRAYKDSADAVIKKSANVISKMDTLDKRASVLQHTTDKISTNQDAQLVLFKKDNDMLNQKIKDQNKIIKGGIVGIILLQILSIVL